MKLLFLLFAFTASLSAQTAVVSLTDQPKAHAEAGATNPAPSLILLESQIGMRSINVVRREHTNENNGEKRVGIVLRLAIAGEKQNVESQFIDYDELHSFTNGIAHLVSSENDAASLELFNSQNTTLGGFSVTAVKDTRRKLLIAVSSAKSGGARVYLTLDQLNLIERLITGEKTNTRESDKM